MENIIPYVIFGLGVVIAFISWLSNRSVTAYDKKIEELENCADDLQKQINTLLQDRADRQERINQRLYDLDKTLTAELNQVRNQLAKIIRE